MKKKFFFLALLLLGLNLPTTFSQTPLLPGDIYISGVDGMASHNGAYSIKIEIKETLTNGTSYLVTNAQYNKHRGEHGSWTQNESTRTYKITITADEDLESDTRGCIFIPAEGDGPVVVSHDGDEQEEGDVEIEMIETDFPETAEGIDGGSDQYYILQGDFFEQDGDYNLLGAVVDGVAFDFPGYDTDQSSLPQELSARQTGIDLPDGSGTYYGFLDCGDKVVNLFHLDEGLGKGRWSAESGDGLSDDVLQELCELYCSEECEPCPGEVTIITNCNQEDFFVHFLIDLSYSVSNPYEQYFSVIKSVELTLAELDSIYDEVHYAVSFFSDTTTVEIPTTTDLTLINNLYSAQQLGSTLVGEAFMATMDHLNNNEIIIPNGLDYNLVLMTDAPSTSFLSLSGFDPYNQIKSQYNAIITVVRYQTGSAFGNWTAAAVASKDFYYFGNVDNNPPDPEGSGPPRKLVLSYIDSIVPGLVKTVISCNNLGLDIPETCEDPTIEWALTFKTYGLSTEVTEYFYGDTLIIDSLDFDSLGVLQHNLKYYGVTVHCANDTCKYTDGFFPTDFIDPDPPQNRIVIIDGVEYDPHEAEALMVKQDLNKNKLLSSQEIDFLLFPNPARNKVSIELSAAVDNQCEFWLLNSEGKRIQKINSQDYQAGLIEFDLTDRESGIYMVQLIKDEVILTKKLAIIK